MSFVLRRRGYPRQFLDPSYTARDMALSPADPDVSMTSFWPMGLTLEGWVRSYWDTKIFQIESTLAGLAFTALLDIRDFLRSPNQASLCEGFVAPVVYQVGDEDTGAIVQLWSAGFPATAVIERFGDKYYWERFQVLGYRTTGTEEEPVITGSATGGDPGSPTTGIVTIPGGGQCTLRGDLAGDVIITQHERW